MERLDPLYIPLNDFNLVEASAGTGKTYTLTALYLRLVVEAAIPVNRILVVTYTNAATKELRDRIRERLGQLLSLIHILLSAACNRPLHRNGQNTTGYSRPLLLWTVTILSLIHI